ncbi:MAG: hypothetical protein M1836_008184 [Candelina mexicana]|nr:MAG: hypothetical protein M1836_008184 [Candelina mexicana]
MAPPSPRKTRSKTSNGKANSDTGKHAKEATAKAAPYPLSAKSPNIGSKRAAPKKSDDDKPTKEKENTAETKTEPSKDAPKSHLEVQLPGEDTSSVPVYDNCDEVRQKLKAFLDSKAPIPGETTKDGKPKTYTQKKLLEHMGDLNSSSLQRFLKAEGEKAGAENSVYYHGYIFLEKLRIYNNEPKSSSRIQTEKDHPNGHELRDPIRHPQPNDPSSQKKKKEGPLYLTVFPGEKPSDVLPPEEKGKYYFPCEHQSGGNKRKGIRKEMGILKKNMK